MTDMPNKQLETMQSKIEQLHIDVVRLTVTVEKLHEERKLSNIKLDKIDNEFSNIKGAVGLLKAIATVFSASVIAFCTWVVTSHNEQQKQLFNNTQRLTFLENKIGVAYDKQSGKN